jgi:hypothetical protein
VVSVSPAGSGPRAVERAVVVAAGVDLRRVGRGEPGPVDAGDAAARCRASAARLPVIVESPAVDVAVVLARARVVEARRDLDEVLRVRKDRDQDRRAFARREFLDGADASDGAEIHGGAVGRDGLIGCAECAADGGKSGEGESEVESHRRLPHSACTSSMYVPPS